VLPALRAFRVSKAFKEHTVPQAQLVLPAFKVILAQLVPKVQMALMVALVLLDQLEPLVLEPLDQLAQLDQVEAHLVVEHLLTL
jgi:uncharacterized membrane protein YwzB